MEYRFEVACGLSRGVGWRTVVRVVSVLTALLCASVSHVWAASFSTREIQVLGRAVAFIVPPLPAGATIAIAYVSGNAASRQDAEAIAAAMGEGLRAGTATLRSRVIDTNALAAGGFAVVIAAAGADGPQIGAAAKAARALCVTRNVDAVRAGHCAMAITTEPRVEILINHAVAAAAGIDFAAAFRMMVQEI